MAKLFLLGWWKCSKIAHGKLHNSVNTLKATELHTKWVNYLLCKLYLNNAIKN